MKKAYVLQNENGYVVGATFELQKASEICYANKGWSYRMVCFYKCNGTDISMVAGPISQEYFPRS
jgi:hypothetical protein